MNQPRIAKLRSQRGRPPYFAGRTEELAALNKRLDDLCETGDPSEGMSLVVGVPGVGKTQLAREFAERAMTREGLDVRWLRVDPALLGRDVGLFREIVKALDSVEVGREIAEMDTKPATAGVGVGAVKGNIAWERVRHTGSLFELLRGSKDAGAWEGKVLVVTIDELQRVRPTGMDALCVLHQGDHGCPLFLVGIGLQHLPQVLGSRDEAARISRVAQTIRLEPLAEALALEAIDKNMLALGHAIPQASAKALANASHGFPQHIHGYLAGALDAIAKHGNLARGAPLDDALKAGDEARTDYYDARLSMLPNEDSMLAVIGAMLKWGGNSLRKGEAVAVLEAASYAGEATVDAAIAHGVLTLEKGGVGFGIPSFHTHMVRRLEAHRRLRRTSAT